jgi:hypothetical protein
MTYFVTAQPIDERQWERRSASVLSLQHNSNLTWPKLTLIRYIRPMKPC